MESAESLRCALAARARGITKTRTVQRGRRTMEKMRSATVQNAQPQKSCGAVEGDFRGNRRPAESGRNRCGGTMSVKPELAFDVCWEVYRGAREVLETKRGISALNWKDTGKFLWRPDF